MPLMTIINPEDGRTLLVEVYDTDDGPRFNLLDLTDEQVNGVMELAGGEGWPCPEIRAGGEPTC
jgi:hypothetical protein